MATITKTVTDMVTKTVASATPSSTVRTAPQGGILEGGNPTTYSASNPIILFIIQAGIIILFCRLLHYPLSLLRQPRVIAEVIGGILLGPSVMGHIPGFTSTIFPTASLPILTLVANLGLVLFLFLVGLEVDLRYFVSNWKIAVSVGAAGMALPFGLGCAIAWGLYHQFHDEPGTIKISFGTYMLFIGTAMAITAFPVLCRILTELKLLSTSVGIIVLSAGVGNDVLGWILLALCVALVNAGSGITALWVLLTCVGYVLFLVFAVRPGFMWVLRRTRSLQDGPSQSIVALTLLIALTSSFFTGVIGVHPIFGAFLAGGFAIKLTEKIEDLVGALFLPLYFALSGLSTNLGLLNTGITWAYVVGVIAVAFFAKFTGGTLAARLNGMVWRESATIGVLMSCKGLVELIVLNIGLQAKILSVRTFTIFVVMALVTTFATTPLTAALYPPWYQRKLEAWRRGEIDWDTGRALEDENSDIEVLKKLESAKVKTLLVYLRLDNMPTLLAFVSLLGGHTGQSRTITHPSGAQRKQASSGDARVEPAAGSGPQNTRPLQVHGVRLVELTERTSTVMKVSELDEYSAFDPVINAFRVLGQLYNMAVSGEVQVIPEAAYADALINRAIEEGSDLLLLPWSETGSMSEALTISSDSVGNKLSSNPYSSFVSKALDRAQCDTAVFINCGFSGSLKQRPSALHRSMSGLSMRSYRGNATQPAMDRSHHIFLPYFGGADGKVAVRLALQLAENPEVTLTIVHYGSTAPDHADGSEVTTAALAAKETSTLTTFQNDSTFFSTMQHSLPETLEDRVVFEKQATANPIADAIARAQKEMGQDPKNGGDIIVLARHSNKYETGMPGQACLGTFTDRIIESGVRGSIVVVRARSS